MKHFTTFGVAFLLIGCLFASERYKDDYISFVVPDALEVASASYNNAYNMFSGEPVEGYCDYVRVMQKGLMAGTEEALATFCRVQIKISDGGNPLETNADMEKEWDSLSAKELRKLDNELQKNIGKGVVVKKWHQIDTARINGLFATKIHYVRKSTSGNPSDVEVAMYDIQNGKYSISITCSYRTVDESLFKPAIQTLLDSIAFRFSADPSLPLYYIKRNNVSKDSFLWPESNPRWKMNSKSSITIYRPSVKEIVWKKRDFSLVVKEVSVNTSSLASPSDIQKMKTEIISNAYINIKKQMILKNGSWQDLQMVQDEIKENHILLKYSYLDSGTTKYVCDYIKESDGLYYELVGEYYPDKEKAILEIWNSIK